MLIPPPLPSYTLSPALPELSEEDLAAVDRCLAGFAGQIPGVLVTAVRTRGLHRIIELETAVGPIIVSERTEVPAQISA